MRISDWSSDVCSSDLLRRRARTLPAKMIPSCQEIFYRVFGEWLLARLDATGAPYFDESSQAALRSFFAALLVAPAVTVTVSFAHGALPPVGASAVIVVTLVTYCLLWTASPLIAHPV